VGIIRFLLAFAVFNSHFPVVDASIVDGHEAVLTFFAISGFYMALILDRTYDSPQTFYCSRLISLYPQYLFALCISIGLLVAADIHPLSTKEQLQEFISDPLAFGLLAWTSLCVVGQEFLFSLGHTVGGGLHFVESTRNSVWQFAPLVQAWSLSLEIVFYAMAPFLVRMKSRTLCALIAMSLSLKLAVSSSSYSELTFFYRLFPCEFWLFGCGIVAYRFFKKLPSRIWITDFVFWAALVATIFMVGDVPDEAEPFALPVAACLALPFIFKAFGDVPLDRFVGRISYPFYLLHFSVIAIFEKYYEEPEGWSIFIVTLAATLLTYALFIPVTKFLKLKTQSVPRLSLHNEIVGHPTTSTVRY
jgi:peptidoglycan/LPS O-acetylase OafA/YrhL